VPAVVRVAALRLLRAAVGGNGEAAAAALRAGCASSPLLNL
jgi:hypothetical protein